MASLNVTIDTLPANNGAAITDIEYRVDGGSPASSGGTTGFTISGLNPETNYDVQIRAVNINGAGAWSDTKTGTTPVEGGGAWDFAQVSSLGLWLKTDEITGANDDPVSTVPDHSGRGKDATAVDLGGGVPALKTAYLDGKNIIDLHSVSYGRSYSLPSDTLTGLSLTEGTAFYLVKCYADPSVGGHDTDVLGDNWSSDTGVPRFPSGDGTVSLKALSSSFKSLGDLTPALDAWRMVSIRSKAGQWDFHIDGEELYSTTSNTFAVGSGTPTLFSWGAYPWGGMAAELGFFSAYLDDTTHNKCFGYVAHKWGLEANLPSGHPYKTVAP